MRETNFSKLFYEFENYGLEKEAPKSPEVGFDFGDELHREYLSWADEFTFAHLKVNNGAMTVGGSRIGDRLYYAVSLCSPQDNFSKAKGRAYVKEHLVSSEHSKKRGVLQLSEEKRWPPAIILKTAAETHLSKMRHKPVWANGAVVEFRTQRTVDRKRKNTR